MNIIFSLHSISEFMDHQHVTKLYFYWFKIFTLKLIKYKIRDRTIHFLAFCQSKHFISHSSLLFKLIQLEIRVFTAVSSKLSSYLPWHCLCSWLSRFLDRVHSVSFQNLRPGGFVPASHITPSQSVSGIFFSLWALRFGVFCLSLLFTLIFLAILCSIKNFQLYLQRSSVRTPDWCIRLSVSNLSLFFF